MYNSLKLNLYFLLQREEGIKLVVEAICSGIFNDLGSGSNVDVCVITKVCSSLIALYILMKQHFILLLYN